MEGMKRCADCRETKNRELFSNLKCAKDGKYSYCKACTKVRSAKRYLENKAEIDARNRAWALANPEKIKQISRAAEVRNRDKRRAQARQWHKDNPGKAAEWSKAWRDRNPGAQAAAQSAWYQRNKAEVAAYDKARREANIDAFLARERAYDRANPEKRRAKNRAWGQANKHKVAAAAALRRAKILERTPGWLTQIDFDVIEFMFASAKMAELETGVPHDVDHIIPLQGKLVSGLHCPLNLQILPASENRSKNNRWVPQ